MLLFTKGLTPPPLLYPQEPLSQLLPAIARPSNSQYKPLFRRPMESRAQVEVTEVKKSTSQKLLQYGTDARKNIVRVSSSVKRRLMPSHKRNAVKSIDIKPEYSRSSSCWVEVRGEGQIARHLSLPNAINRRSAKVAVGPVEPVTPAHALPSAVDSDSDGDSESDIEEIDSLDNSVNVLSSGASKSSSASNSSRKIVPTDIPVIYDAYYD